MFSAKLKQLREDLGISQAELARRAGISRAAVSRYENGERTNISVPTMLALANALVLSWQELVFDTEIEQYMCTMMEGHYERSYVAGKTFLNGSEVRELLDDEAMKEALLKCFSMLNYLGKTEAIKRISEMAEVSKYHGEG